MSSGASSSRQSLRIWAVDVSQWPAHKSSKEALRPLLDDFFPDDDGGRQQRGASAAASTSTSSKPAGGKDIDDSQRVLRYVRDIDRTRSLAALLLPRIAILALIQQEEITPPMVLSWHGLRFARTREGRPYLSQPSLDNLNLDFNISHDGDFVVMALRVAPTTTTRHADSKADPAPASSSSSSTPPPIRRVGIDVMSLLLPHFESSPSTFLDTMQDSVTPDEAQWVRAALDSDGDDDEEGLERLYDLWTYKEALTKNLGLGLGFDFKRVQLAFWECEPKEKRDGRRSVGAVLSMDGKEAPQYVFTEVSLPAGRGDTTSGKGAAARKGSKMVVCEGPFEAGGDGRAQVSPSIAHSDAVERGMLRMWTMQELVDEGRRLCERRGERIGLRN